MTRPRPFLILIVLLAAALCQGCATAARPLMETPDKADPYEYDFPENTLGIDLLKDIYPFKGIDSAEADLRATLYDSEGKPHGTFKGAFAYSAPGFMRIRLFDPMGTMALDIMVNSPNMQIYLPAANTIYEGNAVYLHPNPAATYALELERGSYVLVGIAQEAAQQWQVVDTRRYDPVSLKLSWLTLYLDSKRVARMGFDNYVVDTDLPLNIRLQILHGLSVDVSLGEVQVNALLPDEAFLPIMQVDKEVRPLDALLEGPLH